MQIEGWFNEIDLALLIERIERVKLGRTHFSDHINIVEIRRFVNFLLNKKKTSYVKVDKGSTLII